jgi:hypothetical protein
VERRARRVERERFVELRLNHDRAGAVDEADAAVLIDREEDRVGGMRAGGEEEDQQRAAQGHGRR